MPTCSSCGAETDPAAKFCLRCGQATSSTARKSKTSAEHATITAQNDRFAGALAYLVIFAAAFLILEPYNRNRFVRFHSFQALLMTAAFVGGTIFLQILNALLSVFGLFLMVFTLGFVVAMVWLMMQAFQGERFRFPFLGDLADKYA